LRKAGDKLMVMHIRPEKRYRIVSFAVLAFTSKNFAMNYSAVIRTNIAPSACCW